MCKVFKIMREIHNGVYKSNNNYFTRNLKSGQKVYGEKLVNKDGVEYRRWNPDRSKLAAALKNDIVNFPFNSGDKVLYLGAAQGTTVSHVSDIVDNNGIVYAVEFSERAVRDLISLCNKRTNIAPILADARKPDDYSKVEPVDIVYEDVAQPDQIKILKRNANRFLKEEGYAMVSVKARAIDVTKEPKEIYEEAREELEDEFNIIETIELDPYEEDHCLFVAQKK